ncbi:ATPase AAA [Marinobacter sp. ES-1]|jgi:MoxR-like ATPase|uniref:AAA family ATPase n=1 Tax=Marinobacter vinifirmus TaxID=355591 RepID=A0A259W473_9GAMM|nr:MULTISPECIES: AAA family ATPase [Marinobacter]ERP92680.1 ATPase AAA [Marinobacter sp. ES-1]KRW83099.1 AAA family ATPase [Marinobacter sp. P4B1]MCE0759788.1 AAA family ATPase [Marinobacter sp. G11]OZC37354.1 AAA family ATPase [Marinobacter vinifirmus]TVT34563.1 MAG: AAA family ATPase [Marinobacter vinifirmus]|tara:strand:- start:934 stop:1845 length:912 start_codon:yes stop_codon:yes gene_type:complete
MKQKMDSVVAELNKILLGKDNQIRLALCGLLARGHLLIEDIPGMGKTTLSHALAKIMGLSYQRIQFTNDLLPADVLGYSMYDREAGSLVFHPGPIFAQVVLADEINRASPRTQSALLEAMEERQVSIEGETRPLPSPFFVIATQNPIEQGGTFPLPESQLDRFLMRLQLGYPDPKAERELLEGEDRRAITGRLQAILPQPELEAAQAAVEKVSASPALLDYLQRLLEQSRRMPGLVYGLSPRAGLGLLRAAKAWALMAGRDHVLPDDVQAVFPSVAEHRLEQGESGKSKERVRQLLTTVSVLE